MKKRKIREKFAAIFSWVLYLFLGGLAGVVAAEYICPTMFGEDIEFIQDMAGIVIALIFLIGAVYIHIIIHEAGHLVMGAISGYRFSSFRIGSFIFMKDEGKLTVKKFSLPGTGGQCIMIPVCENYKDTPFVLYNLGGVLANFFVSALVTVLLIAVEMNGFVKGILIIFAATGYVSAITNGVPLQTNAVDNDGRNILTLKNNPEALKEYVNMFFVHELTTNGKRLKDMDDKYFEEPDKTVGQNSITTTAYINRFLREIDKREFENAKKIADDILSNISEIVGVHKYTVMLERMYAEIITDRNVDVINRTYNDKEIKQYLKAAKNTISVARIQYAYALLIKKDEEEAEKHLQNFYKIKKTYPYKVDGDMEEELLLYAKQCN